MDEGLASAGAQPGRSYSRSGCRHLPSSSADGLSPAAAERLNWALRECEKKGLRMTPARRAILACLANHKTPANLSRMQNDPALAGHFDAATVYRTAMLLKEHSIVQQINADHKLRYFVLNSPDESHAYLLCRCCGEVTPLAAGAMEETRCREVVRLGYARVEHQLEIRGLCPRCQTTPGISSPSPKLPIHAAKSRK
jgi:Fe2+ or Zn2+ uptake regulation protein